MTEEQYNQLAGLTENRDYKLIAERIAKQARVRHALDGLTTELGELVDLFKRQAYYGKHVDVTNLKEELGDLEWYRALLLDELKDEFGIEIEDVRATNIAKLRARYPNRFTEVDALNRNLETERQILEDKDVEIDLYAYEMPIS